MSEATVVSTVFQSRLRSIPSAGEYGCAHTIAVPLSRSTGYIYLVEGARLAISALRPSGKSERCAGPHESC